MPPGATGASLPARTVSDSPATPDPIETVDSMLAFTDTLAHSKPIRTNTPLHHAIVSFNGSAGDVYYEILTSTNLQTWTPIALLPAQNGRMAWTNNVTNDFDVWQDRTRYFRVERVIPSGRTMATWVTLP